MARRTRPLVVLLSSRETLRALGAAARSRGLRFRRIEAIRALPCPAARRSRRSRAVDRIDTVVVTSRHAVGPALLSRVRPRALPASAEVWAVGPGTAARLRSVGFRRVRRGEGLGVEGLLARLGRRPRWILHLRSDVAGPATARALRASGHRVRDVVGYRVRPASAALRRHRGAVEGATALVLTSPSVVESLQLAVGGPAVRRLGRSRPAVVLGHRTARAAAAAGFREVVVAPSSSPHSLARILARTVDGAAAA